MPVSILTHYCAVTVLVNSFAQTLCGHVDAIISCLRGCFLIVLDTATPLELVTVPLDVVALLGQDVSFTCEASGNGTFNITWLKNGRLPSNHHWHPNGSELLITSVREHKDCANITCVVENEDGDEVTSSATLTVISKLLCDVTVH